MHSKTEFSAYLVQFDKELLDFFERWRDAIKQCNSKERLMYTNWLHDFCGYVRESLIDFAEKGKLKEPLSSQ